MTGFGDYTFDNNGDQAEVFAYTYGHDWQSGLERVRILWASDLFATMEKSTRSIEIGSDSLSQQDRKIFRMRSLVWCLTVRWL